MVDARVDASALAPTTPIRRELYGSFIEHFHRIVYGGVYQPGSPLSDADGFRLDVAEAIRELGVSVVRWPGGCFVSDYHWRDGVGPDRRTVYDKAWRVDEPNTFGTAEFVRWCETVGITPYICTNAGTGTAEEMADWVEYCNAEGSGEGARMRRAHGFDAPLRVPLWSIGNENYGTWEIGAKDPQEWARLVAESAKMMRRVDPTISLLTAARSDLDWTLPLLQMAGPYLDAVAIHGYWDRLAVVDHPGAYLDVVARSMEPERDIRTTRAIIEAAGLGGAVSIAFDEWNLRGWHHPPGGPESILARARNDRHETYTMADAVFSAAFFNGCLRNADVITMANIAPLVNGRGPLYADDDGIVRRTTFWVMKLYATLLGDRLVPSTGTSSALETGGGGSIPTVDAVVTRRPDGLAIALINRHPDAAQDCAISVDGVPVGGEVELTTLAGDGVDAFNGPSAPDRVVPSTTTVRPEGGIVRLPAHSVSIAVVSDDTREPTADWLLTASGTWRPAADSGPRYPRVDWSY